MKTLYECKICGKQSEDKSEIEKCENMGVAVPLVNIGDVIFFKDCKETPIIYGEENNDFTRFFENSEVGSKMRFIHNMFLDKLYRFVIKNIKVDGHNIEYILEGIKGESVSYMVMEEFEQIWRYPVIYGNDFMQDILDRYN